MWTSERSWVLSCTNSAVKVHQSRGTAFSIPRSPQPRAPAPACAVRFQVVSLTAKSKLSMRLSGGIGASLRGNRIRSTSTRTHPTLHSPVKSDKSKNASFSESKGQCALGSARGPSDFPGDPQIPAYHCGNIATFAEAFSEDHQGQWQWIRGHAKQQGQNFDNESDDCSSWYQSPFAATISAFPSPITPAALRTAASNSIPDTSPSFHTPVRPASERSKPLSSCFRVPDHTGSYSASFTARKARNEIYNTAPPKLQLAQRGVGSPAGTSRHLNFAHEVNASLCPCLLYTSDAADE